MLWYSIKIEQSIVKDSDTAMHVSPEPFYPLVVKRASHDNTPSVSPSMCEHVTSNPNVFTSFITSYMWWQTILAGGCRENFIDSACTHQFRSVWRTSVCDGHLQRSTKQLGCYMGKGSLAEYGLPNSHATVKEGIWDSAYGDVSSHQGWPSWGIPL